MTTQQALAIVFASLLIVGVLHAVLSPVGQAPSAPRAGSESAPLAPAADQHQPHPPAAMPAPART